MPRHGLIPIRPPTKVEIGILLAVLLVIGFAGLAVVLYSMYQRGAVALSDKETETFIYALIYILAALIPILLVRKILKMFNL